MKIIITGALAIGTHLAKLLTRNNDDVTLIDEDAERLNKISSDYDLLIVQASPTSIATLRQVGIADTDLFIGVTPDESTNILACVIAKRLGAKKTVAKISHVEDEKMAEQHLYESMGVDSLIYPEKLAAIDIISGLKMSWVRQRWEVHDGALVMMAIKLRDTCEILNMPLKDISGPEDPYHVVAIKRSGETIIPGGNDVLQLHDLAYFMTTKPYIPFVRKLVGKEHYVDVKNVMIMGGGETAARAINIMPEYMHVKVIERDEERCEELNNIITNKRSLIINGDGRDTQLLADENIKNTQAFVALTDNAETNILACLTAKRMGVRKTVAMVENIDYVNMAESLDIGTIINKKAIAASHIYQMLLDADVMNVRFIMSANADIAEFIPKEGSKVTLKPVKDLALPRDITIGGLVRDGQGMLVSGNTRIQPGDSVMVFCHKINMGRIAKYFI